jgi:hypothetical protein
MRTLILALAALGLSGTAALAAPASVTVVLGPELQAKAEKDYGLREVNELADRLRAKVERRLSRSAAYDGARVELVLTDAKPNRPTFKQLGDVTGLSFESFGIGGAAIEGHAIAPDGKVTPIGYRWYETDITQTLGNSTWHDAEWAFDRVATRLARGEVLAYR